MELVVRIVFGVLSIAGLTVGFVIIIERLGVVNRKVDEIAALLSPKNKEKNE